MSYYPIYDVTGATNDRPEALGTKEKFWLVPTSTMGLTIEAYLFKIGRPQTGENWSAKVPCEILRHVGVPCAGYDFAIHEADAGVISRQFVTVNGRFRPLPVFSPPLHGRWSFYGSCQIFPASP
jgi:hypothetical protein